MTKPKPTVVVAMSGGVDSSVAAGLLLEQGYHLIGVTMLFRSCEDDQYTSWCCGANAGEAAAEVCDKLGIEHQTLSCPDEFEREVLKPAWAEYAKGRTPSPCIICNREIKFGLLFDWARQRGIAYIASGHYARLIKVDGDISLYRGVDPQKDQSYFLFSLTAEQRRHLLFPLGRLDKPAVRELARKSGFSNADRQESQDACFTYRGENFAESLRNRFDESAHTGFIVDSRGEKLASHSGIHNYTIGQRRGLGVSLGKPAFVTKVDAERGEVLISDDPSALESTHLRADGVTWSQEPLGGEEIRCEAQIRYRHQPAPALVKVAGPGQVEVEFDAPQRAISPGQAVVFYNGDRVLGGGWIK